MRYPVVIHKDEASDYGVTIPDILGCFTAGRTIEEALAKIQEAVECHLEDEDQIPAPSRMETVMANPEYAGGMWILADIDTSRISTKSKGNRQCQF